MSWTDWPARRMPLRAMLALLLIGLCLLAVATVDPWLTPLCALLLTAASAEALLPTRYQVEAHALRLDRLLRHRRIPAERIDRVEVHGADLILHLRGGRRWARSPAPLRLPSPPADARAVLERWTTPR